MTRKNIRQETKSKKHPRLKLPTPLWCMAPSCRGQRRLLVKHHRRLSFMVCGAVQNVHCEKKFPQAALSVALIPSSWRSGAALHSAILLWQRPQQRRTPVAAHSTALYSCGSKLHSAALLGWNWLRDAFATAFSTLPAGTKVYPMLFGQRHDAAHFCCMGFPWPSPRHNSRIPLRSMGL